MSNCIFCKIINKEIPSDIIFENKDTLVFLDIKPVNPGHILIVSKKHFEHIADTPEKILCEMMKTAKKVSTALIQALNIKGFNLSNNNGKIAGQVIPHIHFHLIPRYEKDQLKHWPHKEYKSGQAAKLARAIKNEL